MRREFDYNMFVHRKTVETENIEKYEEMMDNKEIFEVQFDYADNQGNMFKTLSFDDSSFSIRLNLVDMVGNSKAEAVKRFRASSLLRKYPVVITKIDKDAKLIEASFIEARNQMSKVILHDAVKGIIMGKPITVNSVITYIHRFPNGNARIEVNVGNCGLKGVIKITEWSTCYTTEAGLTAKSGDIVPVKIFDIAEPSSYKGIISEAATITKEKGIDAVNINDIIDKFSLRSLCLSCSRRQAIDIEPWKDIETRFPVGTVVNITCTDTLASNFFAKVDGLLEINGFGIYPDKKGLNINVGHRYQAFVKSCSEEKKKFFIKPFKELE